ncbi:MAG TPA: DUF6596 domain-containing protein [Microlunatus sp.]|nr:DUF6596 domain-containing protein [Microlunatus sp.]
MTSADRHDVTDEALARVVRAESGLIVASLHRRIGDFDVAEEAVQEAVAAALRSWRVDGVPPSPGGWLATAAWRKAIDLLRVRARGRRLLGRLEQQPSFGSASTASVWTESAGAESGWLEDRVGPDERLPMLFACCHPALAVEARLALTLRAVVGLPTAQIARAFLVPEATMAQRLVRAKRKITVAGIPFTVPEADQLPGRLDDVLTVIAVAYDAGYLDPGAEALAEDAIWLAELVVRALADEPEAWGLLALLTFQSSRTAARFAPDGRLLTLAEQDRTRWDRVAVARADGYLTRAAELRRPGRFQLQAAIAGCHASAATAADTDWLEVLLLHEMLATFDPSPVLRLNRAIALAEVAGPAAALTDLEGLTERLANYHLLHATRAVLLTRLGELDAARQANERALALAPNRAEQLLLRSRLGD